MPARRVMCQHFSEEDVRCGAVAMRRQRYCFHHLRERKLVARMKREQARQRWLEHAPLDNFKSINVAIIKTVNGMLLGDIDSDRCGQMLHKLALASASLRKAQEEPSA